MARLTRKLRVVLSSVVTFFFPPDEGKRDRMLSWAELLPVLTIIVLMVLVVSWFCQ